MDDALEPDPGTFGVLDGAPPCLFSKPSSVSVVDVDVDVPNPFRNFWVTCASDSAFMKPSGRVVLDGVFEVI